MQCFLRGTVQHRTEESNSFRLITNLKVVILIHSKHKHVKVVFSKSIIELCVLFFLLYKYCICIMNNKYFYFIFFKKVRWMVQSGQCLIHKFHLISFIGDYVLVGADISNKYCPPLSFGAAEDDQAIASKNLYLSQTEMSYGNMWRMKDGTKIFYVEGDGCCWFIHGLSYSY